MSERDTSGQPDERLEAEMRRDAENDDDVEILGFEAVEEPEAAPEVFDRAAEAPADLPVETSGEPDGELRERLARAEDRHVRLLADFDNFRKRAERERQESSRHVLAEAIRSLLPVADNLERAMAAEGNAEDLRKGVEMIVRQFLETLRSLEVEAVSALGEAFDPRVHEAVQRTESAEVQVPTVAEEYQRGYLLRGHLIRPSLVRVAVPPDGGEASESEAEP